MQPEIYGPVRYVYQETEDDIEIIIEGDSAWVKEIISDLSLTNELDNSARAMKKLIDK